MSAASEAMRDPASVLSLSTHPPWWSPAALEERVRGPFWETLAETGATIFVTREYEHFVLALSCDESGPMASVLRVPHPSGLAVDRQRNQVHVACTRNPNQILTFGISDGWVPRSDRPPLAENHALAPLSMRFYPGSFYLHDLAIIGDRLFGNAVGMNQVVSLDDDPESSSWWPRSVEVDGAPRTDRNLIQLNSIAAGSSLDSSYFTASTAGPGDRFPGDPDWEVDGTGVVFDGRTREPLADGLTRPHSARLAAGRLFVGDSGHGRLCELVGEQFVEIRALPGWVRGLCHIGPIAVVGTSRVISEYAQYAPGIDPDRAVCGVHFVDIESGEARGSLEWLTGDQIFAIDWMPRDQCRGFIGGDPQLDPDTIENVWYRYAPPANPVFVR